jgi:AraC family transcriptional activator FtrA
MCARTYLGLSALPTAGERTRAESCVPCCDFDGPATGLAERPVQIGRLRYFLVMTPQPSSDADARHKVVALVRAPVSTFELACAAEVFGIVRPGLSPRYSFAVCTPTPGDVATLAGYDMRIGRGLGELRHADTVIIAGWNPPEVSVPWRVSKAVRSAHERGARVVAICTGAFVLAASGLLDGRRATTHWRHADRLATTFPRVDVDSDVLYIDEGDIATSAGSAAGADLCLALVRRDFGAAYADSVARHMVMAPQREGGQTQYAAPPTPTITTATSLGPVLDWAKERLGEPVTLEGMAAEAGLSTRSLSRRFQDQLGESPGRWLLDQRIVLARSLLETTDLPVEQVARRAGLSSAVNMRRRFSRAVGTTPAAYRRVFRPTKPDRGGQTGGSLAR